MTTLTTPYAADAPERQWMPDYTRCHGEWYVRLHNGALSCASYTGYFGPFRSRAHARHWLCETLLAEALYC
jgi:hypothetical protein